jgi:hypothetical protein
MFFDKFTVLTACVYSTTEPTVRIWHLSYFTTSSRLAWHLLGTLILRTSIVGPLLTINKVPKRQGNLKGISLPPAAEWSSVKTVIGFFLGLKMGIKIVSDE